MFWSRFLRRLIQSNLWRLRFFISLWLLSLLWLGLPGVNAQSGYTVTFDFTVSDYGAIAETGITPTCPAVETAINWVSGSGFQHVDYTSDPFSSCNREYRGTQINVPIAGYTNITNVTLYYVGTTGNSGDNVRIGHDNAINGTNNGPVMNGSVQSYSLNVNWASAYEIVLWGFSSADAYLGSITLTGISISGTGSYPTPTPTQTLTPSPVPTATYPPGWEITSLCPGSPVDPGSVSVQYQLQCMPCLGSYFTPDPDVTPTDYPEGYSTATPPPSVGTYEPEPTNEPTGTPAPTTDICSFETSCSWVSISLGVPGVSDVTHVDIDASQVGYAGEYWRVVSLVFTAPTSGNVPLPFDIILGFDLVSPDIPDNIYVQLLSGDGSPVSSYWDFTTPGSLLTYNIDDINSVNANVYYVVVSILSDVDLSSMGALQGLVTVDTVAITYTGSPDAAAAAALRCDLPLDYPQVVGFGFDLGGYAGTSCHTIIPYLDLSLISDVVNSFGWDVGSWFIPAWVVCIDWYALPSIILLGLTVPLSLILHASLLAYVIRTVLKF